MCSTFKSLFYSFVRDIHILVKTISECMHFALVVIFATFFFYQNEKSAEMFAKCLTGLTKNSIWRVWKNTRRHTYVCMQHKQRQSQNKTFQLDILGEVICQYCDKNTKYQQKWFITRKICINEIEVSLFVSAQWSLTKKKFREALLEQRVVKTSKNISWSKSQSNQKNKSYFTTETIWRRLDS